MKSPITTFIFYCFGVVCFPPLSSWYKENRLKHGFVDENLHQTFKQFDLGSLTEDDMVNYFAEYPGVHTPKEQIRKEIDGYFGLDAPVVVLVRKLKDLGFKIALLSNANHAFFERKVYTEFPEFRGLFDTIVISSMVGMVKPDPDIYYHTLKQIGAKPNEAIFIDDVQKNVDAAVALGMHGYLFTNGEAFADYLTTLGIPIT